MTLFESTYTSLLSEIVIKGDTLNGRNGSTRYVFGGSVKADLREGFPLLELRKLNFETALNEFLWDLRGSTNISTLEGAASKFWEPWADLNGNLLTSYGLFMRNYPLLRECDKRFEIGYDTKVVGHDPDYPGECGLDQLQTVFQEMVANPTSRRLAVSMWHPQFAWGGEAIPACHPLLVFSSDGTYLDLMVSGRSNDMATGFPWDMARYALFVELFGHCAGLTPRFVQFTNANSHIYENCLDQVLEMLQRPSSGDYLKPRLEINSDLRFPFSAVRSDFGLFNYKPQKSILMPFNP